MPDYYGLLGLVPGHDPDELRQAFRERMRETDGFLRGERIFLRHLGLTVRRRDLLFEAYAVLADPGLRRDYHRLAGIRTDSGAAVRDRRSSAARFREGCRRLVHRDYDGAYRFFRRALDAAPDDANIVNYATYSLMAADSRRELAREHLSSSLSIDPRRAETMLLLAWMQRRSGAQRLADRAVRSSSTFPVFDAPLYLRLKQVPEIPSGSGCGIIRRIVSETRSAFGTAIRISTR